MNMSDYIAIGFPVVLLLLFVVVNLYLKFNYEFGLKPKFHKHKWVDEDGWSRSRFCKICRSCQYDNGWTESELSKIEPEELDSGLKKRYDKLQKIQEIKKL